jgi:hypothetical protein
MDYMVKSHKIEHTLHDHGAGWPLVMQQQPHVVTHKGSGDAKSLRDEQMVRHAK